MKKLLSILCAVCLLFLCSVPALAADGWSGTLVMNYVVSGNPGNDPLRPYVYYLPVDTFSLYTYTVPSGTLNSVSVAVRPFESEVSVTCKFPWKDSTYSGKLFFELNVSSPVLAYLNTFGSSGRVSELDLPVNYTPANYSFHISSLSAPDELSVASVECMLSDGTVLPVEHFSNTYVVYFSSYIEDDEPVQFRIKYRCSLGVFSMTSAMSGVDAQSLNSVIVGLRSIGNFILSPRFYGTVYSGKQDIFDDTADLINKKNEEIAAAQASQSAEEHEDTVNGFDDSKGQQVNKNLEDGISAYESQEDAAHQDFTDKMDAYEDPDVSDYVSGVSFVSSAVVMWWNALGMFKIILLVGFSLMIFNYISRFRGG